MKLLLDTQLLLWIGATETMESDQLVSPAAIALIKEAGSELYFSAVSVWEVAIKYALGKATFRVDPRIFRRELLDLGYLELAITSEHAVQVSALPHHHKDPFDRLLVAQAMVEDFTLLTVDATLSRYLGPVRRV